MEIMIMIKGDEVIQELFELLLSRYQTGLEPQWEVVVLSFITMIHCIKNVIQ